MMGEGFAFVTEDINLLVDKAVPESIKKIDFIHCKRF